MPGSAMDRKAFSAALTHHGHSQGTPSFGCSAGKLRLQKSVSRQAFALFIH